MHGKSLPGETPVITHVQCFSLRASDERTIEAYTAGRAITPRSARQGRHSKDKGGFSGADFLFTMELVARVVRVPCSVRKQEQYGGSRFETGRDHAAV